VAGFGSGADALLFQATDAIATLDKSGGVQNSLERRAELPSYEKFQVFKGLLPLEVGIRGETQGPTAFSVLWRDRKSILGLVGSRCTQCGTIQYPPQKICVHPECGAVDAGEEYRFSDKKGTIFTYTGDNLAFSFDPPAIYGIVDFEGGGRIWMDFSDSDVKSLSVGKAVEMSFRRRYVDQQRGIYGYHWKAVPTGA
jgi:hydroxymethylglutaryl-CoA synthase